jgi:hypothetical protein
MWYKVQDANRLKEEYEKENNITYDLIIRTRPDIFINKFTFNEDINENILYFSSSELYHSWNDQFAFGNKFVMDIYNNIYNYIDQYKTYKWVEIIVKNQCERFQLKTKICDNITYEIIRYQQKKIKLL